MSNPDAPFTPAGQHPTTPSSHHAATQVVEPAPADAYAPGAPTASPIGGPARRSGLAVAAFVVGLVSLFVSAVPVVNAVSIVGGIVAVVLAVVALRKLAPGVTGKGFAVAGIVLGVVATVVAVIVWVVLGAAAKALEESGELDALLEEAAAVEEAAEAEAPVEAPVEEATVEAAPAEGTADPAAVPADVVREDFSDLSCDVLAEEAVLMSQEEATGQPVLVDIRDSAPLEDHRADYAVPAGTDESLLLTCAGTATWDDATESPVLTELTINGAGELFVAYAGE